MLPESQTGDEFKNQIVPSSLYKMVQNRYYVGMLEAGQEFSLSPEQFMQFGSSAFVIYRNCQFLDNKAFTISSRARYTDDMPLQVRSINMVKAPPLS